jgi:hypothetical protein
LKKKLFLQKCLPNVCELLTWYHKLTFWHPFLCVVVRSLAVATLCQPPPSSRFYCYYRPLKGGTSPARQWSVVRRSTSQNSNQFPVLGCAECGGAGSSVELALLLFPIRKPALCRSGQITKTVTLYDTPCKYQERCQVDCQQLKQTGARSASCSTACNDFIPTACMRNMMMGGGLDLAH